MKYLLLITILFFAIFGSCYYDNEEDLFPDLEQECDTADINFIGTIEPMLAGNCLSCHSNSNAPNFGNNLAIEDYQDVVNLQQAILGAIKHEPPYSPMPKNGNKLNNCLIRQFEIWVENDFPQK